MDGTSTQAGRLVLAALGDERPAAALARLHEAPSATRLMRQLFVVAVRRVFAGGDPRELTAYVRDLLDWHGLPPRGALARDVEALARAALGEPRLAAGVTHGRRREIVCHVLGDLVRPPGAAPGELAALVRLAERRADRYDGPPPRRTRFRR
jgi:hypothetical protein